MGKGKGPRGFEIGQPWRPIKPASLKAMPSVTNRLTGSRLKPDLPKDYRIRSLSNRNLRLLRCRVLIVLYSPTDS